MPIENRRILALISPVLVPAAMCLVFDAARRRLKDREAYVAGFATYWALCAGLSVAILGKRGVTGAFGKRSRGRQLSLGDLLLLAWPAAGAIATRFVPGLPTATKPMLATTAAVAETNAALEELMWRAAFIQLWPDNQWLGYVWPSIGFAAWHLAPQLVHASEMGPRRYLAASFLLGLSWGRVAWDTRSIRWTTLSHVLTDGSGLENSRFFLEN